MAPRRPWLALQVVVAAVFIAVGFALMIISRDAVAAFIGAREDELIGGIRFIGFITIMGGSFLLGPVLLRPRRPTPRAWITDALALGALVLGVVLIGRGHAYAGFGLAALSYVLVSAAACFAIWRPEEIKLRASMPERWQRRVLA